MNKCGCFDIDYPVYNDTYSSCILDSKNLDCNQRELESNQSDNNNKKRKHFHLFLLKKQNTYN